MIHSSARNVNTFERRQRKGKLHGNRAGGGCTVRTCCTGCLVFVCVVGVWAVMSAIERVKSVAKDPTFHFLQRLGSGNREDLEKFLVLRAVL